MELQEEKILVVKVTPRHDVFRHWVAAPVFFAKCCHQMLRLLLYRHLLHRKWNQGTRATLRERTSLQDTYRSQICPTWRLLIGLSRKPQKEKRLGLSSSIETNICLQLVKRRFLTFYGDSSNNTPMRDRLVYRGKYLVAADISGNLLALYRLSRGDGLILRSRIVTLR